MLGAEPSDSKRGFADAQAHVWGEVISARGIAGIRRNDAIFELPSDGDNEVDCTSLEAYI